VFLTDRRASAARAPAAVDPCPTLAAPGSPTVAPRSCSAKRPVAGRCTSCATRPITHLAEQTAALPLLTAKSRHTSLRSLQKYARPSVDAVAKLTADPRMPIAVSNPGQP
jgi:hypothetical protein